MQYILVNKIFASVATWICWAASFQNWCFAANDGQFSRYQWTPQGLSLHHKSTYVDGLVTWIEIALSVIVYQSFRMQNEDCSQKPEVPSEEPVSWNKAFLLPSRVSRFFDLGFCGVSPKETWPLLNISIKDLKNEQIIYLL